MTDDKPLSRREFFRDCGRSAVAGGLVAFGAAMALRQGHDPYDHTCVNQGLCRGCGRLDSCGLPQALSTKRYRQRPETKR